jgi:hypothetical protein
VVQPICHTSVFYTGSSYRTIQSSQGCLFLVVADRAGRARHASSLPRSENEVHHAVNALIFAHGREQRGSVSTHASCVAVHDLERRTDVRREVRLDSHQRPDHVEYGERNRLY